METRSMVAVVIPVYKSEMSEQEHLNFTHNMNILQNYDLYIVYPDKLNIDAYKICCRSLHEKHFPPHYFKNIAAYNKLMLSATFYEAFIDYAYVLICQTDVFIFSDQLKEWCAKDYDYVGAPWIGKTFFIAHNLFLKVGILPLLHAMLNRNLSAAVGNGGFSLRKTVSCIEAINRDRYRLQIWKANEDLYWSFFARTATQDFKYPKAKEAARFSIELQAKKLLKSNKGQLPMGIHAWQRYNREFWTPYVEMKKQIRSMKVSIITITYNAEEFLEKTILSIVKQNCSCFEYIIIDGNSSDSTLDIIKEYEQKIKNNEYASISIDDFHWRSEKDGGLYDAMNKGIDRATGDFVWFINAGDKIYNNSTLQEIINTFNIKPASDVIYGQSLIIDKDDCPLGERHKIAPKNLSKRSLLNGLVVCHQSILVSKRIAKHYDTKYKVSADYDWVCNAISNSKRNSYIDDYISKFMTSGISNTHRKQGLKERFFIMKKHFGLFQTIIAHISIILRYPFTRKYH